MTCSTSSAQHPWQCRPMAVRLQILVAPSLRRKAISSRSSPGCRIFGRGFLARRHEAVTWDGVTYGNPTNNETMALIWNADIFKRAELDPDLRRQPGTICQVLQADPRQAWDRRLGLVARKNAGNRPLPLHAAALGFAAAYSTRPIRARIKRDRADSEPASGRAGVIRHLSATSWFRFRPLLTSRRTTSLCSLRQLGMMISHHPTTTL